MPEAAERVAAQVLEGLRALREGRVAEAADLLEVCVDPEWVAAADTADLRCRAMSHSANALWLAGRHDAAARRAEAALQLARALGDLEGIHATTDLHARILASRPAAAVHGRGPAVGGEGRLRSATEAIEAGDAERSYALASEAVQDARGDVRVAVLGRLLMARARPAEAAALLPEAAEIARDAEEATLLGAVARSAELCGVDLGTMRGPDLVSERR